MIEPCSAKGRRWSAQAFPRIQCDVMVITAGGKKRGLVSHALHQLKSKHVPVKPEGTFQVRYFQVYVANANLGINRLEIVLLLRHDYPAVCCALAKRFA